MGIFRFPLIGTLWTQDCIKGLGIKLKCRNWLDEIVENPTDCNLVYTLRLFQPFADDFPEDRFHFIGPSVYDRREADFPTLSKQVIYVSVGTILKGTDRFFRACIEAFREQNGTVVLSVGNSFDTAKLGDIPDNFLVCNRVPQMAVLKQASLFITHGGMNSVSEAQICGVPMVVIPFVSDQPVNAEQVARLGLGKILDYKTITPTSLKDTAFATLSDETVLKNVQAMKEMVAHAPGNAGAVDIIEKYCQD